MMRATYRGLKVGLRSHPIDMKILLVDDEVDQRRWLETRLQKEFPTAAITCAQDGEEALRQAAAFSPDVIILDERMPGMSGLQVCRSLKASPNTRDASVLMVSAVLTTPASRAEALSAGAENVLLKPFETVELVAYVRNLYRLKEQADQLRARKARLREALTRKSLRLTESEARYKLLVEHQTDYVYKIDAFGHFDYVSPSACQLLDKEEADLLGCSFLSYVHPEDMASAQACYEECFRPPHETRGEHRVRTRHGWLWLATSARAHLDDQGEVIGVVATSRDVTAHRDMEDALRRSAANYHTIFNATREGIFIHDPINGRILDANVRVVALLGYTCDELLHLDVGGISSNEEPFTQEEALRRIHSAAAGKPQQFRWQLRRKDGKRLWVEVCLQSTELEGLPRVLATIRDISESVLHEQQAMEEHAQRLRHLEALVQLAQNGYGSFSAKLNHLLETSARVLGVERVSYWSLATDAGSLSCESLYHLKEGPLERGAVRHRCDCPDYFTALRKSECIAVNDVEQDPRTRAERDSYLRPLGIHSLLDVPVQRGGRVVGVLSHEQTETCRAWTAADQHFALTVANHVALALEEAERRRARQEMERLATAVNQAAEAVVITDLGGTIQYVNPAFERITGYRSDEAIGQTPKLLKSGQQDAAFYDRMWKTILGGETWVGEVVNRRKDGELYTEEMTITPVRDSTGQMTNFIALKSDVTGRKDLEIQLLQAQKMEAIGRLAGGVAHDFNNLLTVIMGYGYLILESLAIEHPLHQDMATIVQAGESAQQLTRQLLAFSRKDTAQLVPLHLNKVIRNVDKLLERVLGEDIERCTTLEGEPDLVRADAGLIEQLLLNLAVNARDAMPGGGRLEISTKYVHLTDADCRQQVGTAPGEHVVLTVSDNGCGMSKAVRQRAFEPFFTTKESGRGTGLGLSTVFGIVQQCGGHIEIDSSIDVGTTFRIHLPVQREEEVPDEAPPVSLASGGHETVLVVEDEDALRVLTRRILTAQGYRVLEASSGAAALRLLEKADVSVDLLLTDVVMPGMSGPEMVAAARRSGQAMPVLFISGFPDDRLRAYGFDPQVTPFMAKPFTPAALAAIVRTSLDSGRRDSARSAMSV